MIEIYIKNKLYKINPELTIWQFQRIHAEQSKIVKSPIETIALLLDIDAKELKRLPKREVDATANILMDILTQPKLDERFETFEFNGVKYGLENDWTKLAWGAWQDFEILSAENIEKNIHHLMAILYRPIVSEAKGKYKIKPYDEEDVIERSEIFRDLPVKYWFAVSGFFLLIGELYITDIKSSLVMETKLMKLVMMGMKILPKWVKRRLPLDTILTSLSTLQKKISRS